MSANDLHEEPVIGIGAASAPAPAKAFHTDPQNFAKQEPKPLTIPEAMFRARQILATPEMLFDTEGGRRIIVGLLAGIEYSPAYAKAISRGQDVFVLVEQDQVAPYAIRTWAEISGNHGTPPEKVLSAQAKAKRWQENALPGKKWPD